MRRQSRERRNKHVRVQLTERDELLIEALLRFRLARTSDLARTAFFGVRPTTCGVRLRRLFDAGFLDVRVGDRSEENVYTLGARGRHWASENGLSVGRIPRGSVEHHLAIVRAWSTLAAELGRLPGVELELARADWDLREEFGTLGLAVVPDLFLAVRVREQSVALAVEVDLGTESLSVLRAKVEAYEALAVHRAGLFGYRDFAVVVGVATAGRLPGVRRALDEHRRHGEHTGQRVQDLPSSIWQGGSMAWLLEESPGIGLAKLLGDLLGRTGGPATDPDYGNGRSAAVSASESAVEPTDEEGL